MIKILIDHNIEGYVPRFENTIFVQDWKNLVSIKMLDFKDVNLAINSNDRLVWQFAQRNEMILLTDNRNDDGPNSLERTIDQENTPDSLPVLTIGNITRVVQRNYRERCVERLIEIILDLDNYKGTGRLYIP